MTGPGRFERLVRPFEPADAPALREVMAAALEADRPPGFTAYDAERSLSGMLGEPSTTLVAVEDGVARGYATPRYDDLTVHPAFRRRGHGRRLLAASLELAAAGLAELILYVPAAPSPGRAFARAMGLAYRSSLWLFELGPGVPVPAAAFPADVRVREFGAWLELGPYVAMMNAAFAGHPTPLSWTEREIAYANTQPGFDPADVLVAAPADRPTEPVAFVRTRMRPSEPIEPGQSAEPAEALGQLEGEAREPLEGEIALVGVLPGWRGRGLGRELLRWGIGHVRGKGAARVRLAVEAGNERALELYRRTGFVPVLEWPHWSIAVPPRERDRA